MGAAPHRAVAAPPSADAAATASFERLVTWTSSRRRRQTSCAQRAARELRQMEVAAVASKTRRRSSRSPAVAGSIHAAARRRRQHEMAARAVMVGAAVSPRRSASPKLNAGDLRRASARPGRRGRRAPRQNACAACAGRAPFERQWASPPMSFRYAAPRCRTASAKLARSTSSTAGLSAREVEYLKREAARPARTARLSSRRPPSPCGPAPSRPKPLFRRPRSTAADSPACRSARRAPTHWAVRGGHAKAIARASPARCRRSASRTIRIE